MVVVVVIVIIIIIIIIIIIVVVVVVVVVVCHGVRGLSDHGSDNCKGTMRIVCRAILTSSCCCGYNLIIFTI